MGVAIPAEWGGAGMDAVAYAVAMEEISRGCAGTGVIMSVQNSLYCDPVQKFGTTAQKRELLEALRRAASGWGPSRSRSRRAGPTPPRCGPSPSRAATSTCSTAPRTSSPTGRRPTRCSLFATTDQAKRHKGITAFLVPTDAKGFTRAKARREGRDPRVRLLHALLRGVRHPEAVPARRGGGGVQDRDGDAGRRPDRDRGAGARHRAGGAARRRWPARGSGRPSASRSRELQAIQFMLADMATELDAARLLTLRAAALKDAGAALHRRGRDGQALRLRGGGARDVEGAPDPRRLRLHEGVRRRAPLARRRITEIYEGTSEIQRLVIAASVLKG